MPTGEFEKLRIISYTDPDFSDEHKGEEYVALINPESYTLETKVEFSNNQGSGTSGNQPRFTLKPPEELAFEFLFDNTGIIDGNPKDDIADDLQNFKDFLMKYEGDIHRVDQATWRKDIRRRERVEDLGWRMVRVTADDVARPAELIRRLRRLLA